MTATIRYKADRIISAIQTSVFRACLELENCLSDRYSSLAGLITGSGDFITPVSRIDRNLTRMINIGTKLINNERKLINIETKVMNIGSKVINIERKVINIETKLNNIERKVINIERKLNNIERKVITIERKVINIGRKLITIERKVINIGTKVINIERKFIIPLPGMEKAAAFRHPPIRGPDSTGIKSFTGPAAVKTPFYPISAGTNKSIKHFNNKNNKTMKRIALKLDRISVADIIVLGRKIVAEMGAHADRFPEPFVALPALTVDLNDLEKLERNCIGGGSKTDTVLRNQKLADVKLNLEILACYVQGISRGDEAIIREAGMEVRAERPRKYEDIGTPVDLRAAYTDYPGELKLRWKKVKNARQYGIECCTGVVTQDKWALTAHSSTANVTIRNLPSGELVSFRVYALSAAGRSSYSEVVSRKLP